MKGSMDAGIEYVFLLQSGRKVRVIFHGDVSDGVEVSINGVRGVYKSLQEALGEPYVSYS